MISFSKPQIEFMSREKYSILKVEDYEVIEFNIFLDSCHPGYEYWFEVGIDFAKFTIRITCKILKNGLTLKAQTSGIIHLLINYSLKIFPNISYQDESLRVNPIDGAIKYTSMNFFTRLDIIDKLTYPSYLCNDLKCKITVMEEKLNKHVLGRIL